MNPDANDAATRGKVVTDTDPAAKPVVKKPTRHQRRQWMADARRRRRRNRGGRGMPPEQRKRGPDMAVAP